MGGPMAARLIGAGHAVTAVKHANQRMLSRRGGAVALAFVLGGDDPAAAQRAGKAAAHEAQAHRGDDQILPLHRRCPDLAALSNENLPLALPNWPCIIDRPQCSTMKFGYV